MTLRTQAFLNTIGNTVYLVSLWLLTVITTQLLGDEAVGILTLSITLGNVFAIIQSYAVRMYQSSDMTYHFAPRDYLQARIITVTAGALMAFMGCVLLGYSASVTLAVVLFVLLKSSESFSDVLFGEAQRCGHLEYAGYSMLLRGTLIALLFFTGAFFARKLETALMAAAAGCWALSLLMDLPLYRKTLKQTRSVPNRGAGEVLRKCLPLVIAALLPTAVTAIPRIVLERCFGTEILGYYGNVSAPALFLSAITPSVLAAFLPRYGKALAERDYREIRRIMGFTFLLCIGIGGAGLAGALLFGRPILILIYTERLQPYVHYLIPVILSTIVYTLDMCAAAALISMRESKKVLLAAVMAFAVSLILSVPLVRAWGMGGAVAALVIPYGVQAVLQTVWVLQICRRGGKEKTP